MSTFGDGCTFPIEPVKRALDAAIGLCCDAHDAGLDHTFGPVTFVVENVKFAWCTYRQTGSFWLSVLAGGAVSSLVGLGLYLFGPKRPGTPTLLQSLKARFKRRQS